MNDGGEITSEASSGPHGKVGEREVALTFEVADEQAWQEIERFLQQMQPYDFQDLVAALLKGMGYHVAWVAPPGKDGGTEGVDNEFAEKSFENIGAWILGRNMFSPLRGPWLDESWKGWWGDNPPYHVPVFVVTHHQRPSLVMEGGTVFHFVTEGYEAALTQAKQAAKGMDVRVGGGVATVRHYLKAGLIGIEQAFGEVDPVQVGVRAQAYGGLEVDDSRRVAATI